MGAWDRIRDWFGASKKDFAVEGDRLVFRSLRRAKEIPLEPPLGPADVSACASCKASVRRVIFTTAGGGDQIPIWRAHPLAVDGWVCVSCGWSAVPRRLSAAEGLEVLNTGVAHAQARRFDDAEFWFRRIVASWPGFPDALTNLGALHLERSNDAETAEERASLRRSSMEYLERAIASSAGKPNPNALLGLARAQALVGREDDAIAQLDALASNDDAAADVRAAARELGNDIKSGKALFSRAVELANPHIILADRRPGPLDDAVRAQLREAAALLRSSATRKPAFATHWMLGKVEERLGDLEAARGALADARACNPDQPDGCREYVQICLTLERIDEALPIARHAVLLKPNDGGLLSNLALVLLLAGELDEASKTIRAALRMDPDDAITRTLSAYITDVRKGRRPQPKTLAELEGRR